MVRSLWKGPFIDSYLIKKIPTSLDNLNVAIKTSIISSNTRSNIANIDNSLKSSLIHGSTKSLPNKSKNSAKLQNTRGIIKVWSRRSFILPEFINKFFEIHNGKQFISLQVNEDMVGHKFGEFASTRKKTLHKKKQKA